MLDVLIISPNIDYYSSGEPYITSINIENSVPLGALSITQYLTDCGLSVKFLHLPSMGQYVLSEVLKDYPANLVLIQCHWFLYGGGAVKVARTYKSIFCNSKIFLGGYHASYFAKEILSNADYIDGIIVGEGEKVAKNLYEELSNKRDLTGVGSIIYKKNGTIVKNPSKEKDLLNVNEIPIIDPRIPAFSELHAENKQFIDSISFERGRYVKQCNFCVSNTAFTEG